MKISIFFCLDEYYLQCGVVILLGLLLLYECDQQNCFVDSIFNFYIECVVCDLQQGQVDIDMCVMLGLDVDWCGEMVEGGECGVSNFKFVCC